MHYSYFWSILLITYLFLFLFEYKKNVQELSLSFKVQSDFFRNACAEYWIMNDLSSRLWNMNWMHLYFLWKKNRYSTFVEFTFVTDKTVLLVNRIVLLIYILHFIHNPHACPQIHSWSKCVQKDVKVGQLFSIVCSLSYYIYNTCIM